MCFVSVRQTPILTLQTTPSNTSLCDMRGPPPDVVNSGHTHSCTQTPTHPHRHSARYQIPGRAGQRYTALHHACECAVEQSKKTKTQPGLRCRAAQMDGLTEAAGGAATHSNSQLNNRHCWPHDALHAAHALHGGAWSRRPLTGRPTHSLQ